MIETRVALAYRMFDEPNWNQRLIAEPFLENVTEWADKPTEVTLDFHLGSRFQVPRRRPAFRHDPNPRRRSVKRSSALPGGDILPSEFFVDDGDEFVLHPNQHVLGVTKEWFRFPMDLCALVIVRSIWARRGLIVANAPLVQPLSSGNITLELSTLGDIAVVLRPGDAIGELVFLQCGPAVTQEVATKDVPEWLRPYDLGLPSRPSTFAAASRPGLGDYHESLVERFYLEGRHVSW